jgi:hypothetical protein
MDELYHETALSNSRLLCVGPITREEASDAGASFCDGFGCYLYLAYAAEPRRPISVLAKFVSPEAAASFILLMAGIADRKLA